MRRRTWLRSLVLGGAAATGPLLLAACQLGPAPPYASGPAPSILPAAASARSIAILAPLSGPYAARGDTLVKAAQLALAAPGSPRLDVQDTHGTAEGAQAAAQAAISGGAGLIIGPLTTQETSGAAGPALAAHVPVLAFTTDPAQARPGVWPLGITPGQQVRRLVQAATADGKTRFAALLPDSDFGHAMGTALAQEVQGADIRFHAAGNSAIRRAVNDIAQYDVRAVQPPAAPPADTTPQPGIPDQPVQPSAPPAAATFSGPPPFDALLVADTGASLSALTGALASAGVAAPDVRLLGPALWAEARTHAGASLEEAWFAAPDPAARLAFDQAYTARYGAPASGLADLAYDAAGVARATAAEGFAEAALTRPDGFPGADGLLGLLPDGHARRALAVFAVHGGAAAIVQPAPSSLNAPGT